MDILTLDLSARIAAKKAATSVISKINEKKQALSDKRAALKDELNTTVPQQ